MKAFMDDDFLLTTKTAQALYHNYAQTMPIFDYHSHVSPREIFENRRFENMAQVWLEGDHYKWRLMRTGGVAERYITGDASDWEKFQKFAQVLPRAVGNPLYHWCHMELKEYFGYTGTLNGDTASAVWALCNAKLAEDGMDVRGLIAKSDVAFLGTTDDPADSLEWHKKIRACGEISAEVAPSFRPDRAFQLERADWRAYMAQLSHTAQMDITDLDTLEEALCRRMDDFASVGCRAADHGLAYVMYQPAERAAVSASLKTALAGGTVTEAEGETVKTALMRYCARQYAARGWVMQWHYNCLRNPNGAMFHALGPDAGFDTMNDVACGAGLAALLNAINDDGGLPRTILYSLNPGDNAMLDAMAGAFQDGSIAGKVQHGSAWWYSDTKTGMTDQLTSLANLGVLGSFVGMLTDSRSFTSYTRHAYFRRILCALMGTWVENGEYPADMETLGGIVQDICYRNAAAFFNASSGEYSR